MRMVSSSSRSAEASATAWSAPLSFVSITSGGSRTTKTGGHSIAERNVCCTHPAFPHHSPIGRNDYAPSLQS